MTFSARASLVALVRLPALAGCGRAAPGSSRTSTAGPAPTVALQARIQPDEAEAVLADGSPLSHWSPEFRAVPRGSSD